LRILFSAMNALEIFIVYLSCGAPFGVHFYFQNRSRGTRGDVFLKSFLTVVVWIPYALRLLHANITKKLFVNNFDGKRNSDSRRAPALAEAERRLIRYCSENCIGLSVFEIREIVERYAGLTLAVKQFSETDEGESELLKVANHENVRLGTKCLSRRNRLRLEFHQTLARGDFLKLLANEFSSEEIKKISPLALEFVTLLSDEAGARAIENLCAEALQIQTDLTVRQGEKTAVWKSFRERKPQPGKIISARIRRSHSPKPLTATISSRSKD
jgi:hypothetical protein